MLQVNLLFSDCFLVFLSRSFLTVDRLLESLLKEDFEDFIRVGSLKRISSKILPYSVSSSAGADRKNSDKEAIKDVKAMLRSKDITREEQGSWSHFLYSCKTFTHPQQRRYRKSLKH